MRFSVLDITANSADNNLLATIIIRLDCVSYELASSTKSAVYETKLVRAANQNVMGWRVSSPIVNKLLIL